MTKRRATRNPLRYLKQGVASAFICTVALFPLLGFWQIPSQFIKTDPRKVAELPAMIIRPADAISSDVKLFDEPLISVTFDDGRESVYTNAAPLLQKFGIHTTQYLISGTENDKSYVSNAQIDSLSRAGHEIACHTVSHPDLTTLDNTQLANEFSGCKNTFSKYGSINNFASPFGHTNDNVITQIKQYYLSHRNTNGDITNGVSEFDVNISKNFNRYNIISAAIRQDTTVAQLKAAVQYAIDNKGWVVFTYHQIEDTENATFGLNPESLNKQLAYLSSTNIRIVTMKQALHAFDKTNSLSAVEY